MLAMKQPASISEVSESLADSMKVRPWYCRFGETSRLAKRLVCKMIGHAEVQVKCFLRLGQVHWIKFHAGLVVAWVDNGLTRKGYLASGILRSAVPI